ncbi:MAG TPA: S-methyl-5-thioribose-1-phosphate isomerase [Chitinivibrionales bacterium]|nr:S-methyl-5-thioribose-1-phosphate isomerase [Chitinivibrionales bacterium]
MARLKTIEWIDNCARIVDQTALPSTLIYKDIKTIEEMYDAVKTLRVRGAPAIGVAAAFGLYLGIRGIPDSTSEKEFTAELKKKADYLVSSRPTAVNLAWAIKRMVETARSSGLSISSRKKALLDEALKILEEDRQMCLAIGKNGYDLIKTCKAVLTHCNAGGLATAEYGTALAPVYVAQEKGRLIHVYADETRPLLQGSRITAFELMAADIPVTVICDDMAATVMARGLVEAVLVGADRIAANGDTANKIGTYGVALLAKAHHIPFYVAAPSSTFDLSLADGNAIPIEERPAQEIISGFGKETAPRNAMVFNPAFDVTPNKLITAIVSDKGVMKPPFQKNIKKVLA